MIKCIPATDLLISTVLSCHQITASLSIVTLGLSPLPSRFLKLQPCGKNGYSPLHLAVDRNTTCVGRYPVCKFPSLTVASILLECGADVNCRDEDDNRCLEML